MINKVSTARALDRITRITPILRFRSMARFAVVERHRTASSGACGPRCACAVFYSHPRVWNEIGFPGPAYPYGYKHPGVDAR